MMAQPTPMTDPDELQNATRSADMMQLKVLGGVVSPQVRTLYLRTGLWD